MTCSAAAQELKSSDEETVDPYADIEELVVEGERPDPASMDLIEMDQIYNIKENAARDFKLGRYEKAFPHLLMLAKAGFKDAQARVGYIYLHGLGGQKKSNLKAIGWIGVAASGTTRPAYRNILNQLIAETPEAQQQLVASTIDEYRNTWDSEKMGVDCFHSRTGHIAKLTCRYSSEFDKHQDQLMLLAAVGGLPW